jgi:hypothetical protein
MVREIRKTDIPYGFGLTANFHLVPIGVRFVGYGDPIEYSDKTPVAFDHGQQAGDIGFILSQKERGHKPGPRFKNRAS